jgi:hypothetical protein
MTQTPQEIALEAAALEMKIAMGLQLNAKPLLGDTKSRDWHATGGSINFNALAQLCLSAYHAKLLELGATDKLHNAEIMILRETLESSRVDVKLLLGAVLAKDPNNELRIRCEDILRRTDILSNSTNTKEADSNKP